MVNPVHKGKRAENAFCKWLLENLGIETEREYNQADGRSSDIVIGDFFFEVKHRETLDLDEWWYQTVRQRKGKKGKGKVPVVVFKQNRRPWQFLIPASLLFEGIKGYMIVNEKVFIQFAMRILK